MNGIRALFLWLASIMRPALPEGNIDSTALTFALKRQGHKAGLLLAGDPNLPWWARPKAPKRRARSRNGTRRG